jgi:predicted GIY-YIG superfamily endonuclease
MHYVYILRSEVDKRLYVSLTDNVERRLKEHEQGKVAATAGRKVRADFKNFQDASSGASSGYRSKLQLH